jgi:hypothetical protein
LGRKKYHLQKHSYTFKLSKIKGPIQVLASAWEKHNYINLAFETNANSSEKRMYKKSDY